MNVEVIVPWRGGCPHREASLTWLTRRWTEVAPAWSVVLAEAPDGPWVKAGAILDAGERTTADIVVVSDADVWCDGTTAAVEAVAQGAPWAVPHDLVYRLTEEASGRAMAGEWPGLDGLAEKPYRGHAGGGIVVMAVETLRAVPPDPRFVGWGQEDDAWAEALRTIVGQPWRGKPPLWHLHHPPQPRLNRRIGNRDNVALHRRYIRARRNPELMAALIDEGRSAWRTSASS